MFTVTAVCTAPLYRRYNTQVDSLHGKNRIFPVSQLLFVHTASPFVCTHSDDGSLRCGCPHMPHTRPLMNSAVVLLLDTKLKGWMWSPHALPVLTPKLRASVLFASSEMWNQSLSVVPFYRTTGPRGERLPPSLPPCVHCCSSKVERRGVCLTFNVIQSELDTCGDLCCVQTKRHPRL